MFKIVFITTVLILSLTINAAVSNHLSCTGKLNEQEATVEVAIYLGEDFVALFKSIYLTNYLSGLTKEEIATIDQFLETQGGMGFLRVIVGEVKLGTTFTVDKQYKELSLGSDHSPSLHFFDNQYVTFSGYSNASFLYDIAANGLKDNKADVASFILSKDKNGKESLNLYLTNYLDPKGPYIKFDCSQLENVDTKLQ